MKTSAALLTLTFLLGTSATALAAATPEEAQRLTALFQSYVGAEPGVVKVEPAGDSYTVTLDFAPYIAKVKEQGFSASFTPIVVTLTDQSGGKWKVDQDQPIAMAFKVGGKAEIKASVGSIKGTGIFDEALGVMASSMTDYSQFAFEENIIDGSTNAKVAYTLAGAHVETTATGSDGTVDAVSKSTYTDLRETITMPPQPGLPPMDFAVAAASGTQDAAFKGLKAKAAVNLMAWFVARPSPEAIIADQAQLKDQLNALLPLFGNVSMSSSTSDLSVNTILGKFSAERADFLADLNGFVENGALREKITLTGFKAPDGVIPPWAASLVPQNFTVDFNVADFNLAAPAKLIIDNLDLTKKPPLPKEMEQQLLQALLPNGTVTVGLGPSEVIASIFDLKAEGSMVAGPAAMPSGQATVKLKGIDEIMAALQAAPPEMGMQQMAPMVIIAKGMAKADGDYLSWKIESTPQGSVTVNGVDPTKMGGQ